MHRWTLRFPVFHLITLIGLGLSAISMSSCATPIDPTATATIGATPSPMPSPLPPTPATAQWTMMIYMCGDNDLERAATADFNEMEAAGGSTDAVHIVTQLSLPGVGTRRYLVEGDTDFGRIASKTIENLGRTNMADPDTLQDFIVWATEAYPANRYALLIWNHGAGWPGALIDQPAGDELTLPDLTEALNGARVAGGPQFFDLIGFDAGLMAQLETFDAIAPFGEIAVASEEAVPANGWDYTAVLAALRASPAMDGRALAEQITQAYISYYAVNNPHPFVTLSAVRLADIGAVTEALGQLVAELSPGLSRYLPALSQARAGAEAYKGQAGPDMLHAIGSIDLQHFADLLAASSDDETIIEASRVLANAVTDAVLLSAHDTLRPHAGGIAIHFPPRMDAFDRRYAQQVPMAGSTGWADMTKTYVDLMQSSPVLTLDTVESDRHTASIHEPALIEFELIGPPPETVWLLAGTPTLNGGLRVQSVDILNETRTEPKGSGQSRETTQPTTLFMTWDTRVWSITDGTTDIPALLWPVGSGPTRLAANGYYVPKRGKPVDGNLIFDARTGRLEQVWAYRKQNQFVAPFEILPRQGDQFTIYDTTLDGMGGLAHEKGPTVAFGDHPLTISQMPAGDGEYAVAIRVIDRAGRVEFHQERWEVVNKGLDLKLRGYTDPAGDFAFLYPVEWSQMSYDAAGNITARDPTERVTLTISPIERETTAPATELLQNYLRRLREIIGGEAESAIIRHSGHDGLNIASATLESGDPTENQVEVREVAVIIAGEQGYIVEVSGPADAVDAIASALTVVLDSWQLLE